ncbi:PHB depolymerase family esterase [Nocardia transvalensis]|uniref:extracellular catalytic domain type 2 short-chain-length polyhydroxyalkanoate depolymerase n=1 Tax=Nocardia transvalensis TaxID=37333 RepID=UPI0018934784|nr:PHB depolymerase family esterase [Nocardia transvalensis]MBF6331251.1 poly(3-hydroxybutyrate) depolymerase [Nocardia transvalensis]
MTDVPASAVPDRNELWTVIVKITFALPLLAAAVTLLTTSTAQAAVPSPTPGTLGKYTISASYVAGVSSGGYMADQLHVAYSGTFEGAGIFTAGPYHCAQGRLTTAQLACMNNLMPDNLPALEQTARQRAGSGAIDSLDNLSGHKVWLYHGTNDSTVKQSVNDDLATFYRDFGADVSYTDTSQAGHAWVSPLGPNPCTVTRTPYINNCGDDPQQAMLSHLLGTVRAPAAALSGTLIGFDQKTFVPGGADPGSISLGRTGFAYVPTACASESCTLLVALHGCNQNYDNALFGAKFMAYANLNEYADTNHMIVLYPQASANPMVGNPQGCWNWWGYGSDSAYDQHGGKQLETIMNMVRTITGTT